MRAFIIEMSPFPYEDRALLVAEDTTILAGEKLNFRSIYSGPSDLYAAQDLNTDLWGVFDDKGEEVLPFEYEEINTNRRRFELKRGEETTFMDGGRSILSKEPGEEEPEILSKFEEKHGSRIYSDSNFFILKNYAKRQLTAFNTEGQLITEWPAKSFTTQFLVQDDLLITFSGESKSFGEVKTFDPSGHELHHFEAIERDEDVLKVTNHLRIKQDDLSGYIDRSFEPLTDIIFHEATPMIFGRAFVKTEEDGPWKLIDETGETLREFEPGWESRWYGGKSSVSKYYAHGLIPISFEGEDGAINRDGQLVVPLGSSRIFAEAGYIAYDNSEERSGIITHDGTTVVPHEYDMAIINQHGEDTYFRVAKDGLWGLLDEQGEEVLPMEYARLGYINELGQLFAQDKESEKCGMIDLEGNVVLPFEYDDLKDDRYGAANGFWTCEHNKFYYNLATGVSFRVPEDFPKLHEDKFLNTQFSTFKYGDIVLDKQGNFLEKIDYDHYEPLPDEKSHTYALNQLIEDLTPKTAKKLFKKVIYWNKSYWDVLRPHLQKQHLPVVETLLKIAAKKPYGKEALAGGEEFFVEGLRIVGEFDPERVVPLAEELLKAGSRKKDRAEKLASAMETATSLSFKEPKKVIPLRHLAEVWAPVVDHLKEAHGDAADWSDLDEILSGDLRAAVEEGKLAGGLKPFEKPLKKIARKDKNDDIKEVHDSLVVL